MNDTRRDRIRLWSLGVSALGMALWIGSIAVPYAFGEDRGWSEEQSLEYESAGARLHDLMEGLHDHDSEGKFADPEIAKAFAEAQRQKPHRHVHVDPAEFAAAQKGFAEQKAKLESVRSSNHLQVGVLFWGGIALMFGGGVTFFAANSAIDD